MNQNKSIILSFYRIEFQVRGLPHLHGVFWLTQAKLKEFQDENGEFINEKVPSLIDEFVSCSIGETKLMRTILSSVEYSDF